MTFRTRLLVIFTVAVVAAVGMVELLVSNSTRQAFERLETRRVDALIAQFRREFDRRRQEIVRAVNAVAASDAALNRAISGAPDYEEAATLAAAHGLELLELVAGDGTILSSKEWPARFGYKEDWLAERADWKDL